MSPSDRGANPGLDLGAFGLVSASIRLLFTHFGFLFPLAFVPATVVALVGWLAAPAAVGPNDVPAPDGGAMVLVLFAFLFDVIVGFVVTGLMCLAAIDVVIGKRHTLGEYISQVKRYLAPIIVLGTVLYVLAGVGFALFIVPGLYIIARFLPWVPAIVFENAGWSGLTRGQELTAGHRWPLTGAMLLIAVLGIALTLLIAPLATLAGAGGGIAFVAIQGAVTAITYALVAIFTALVYARLRNIKEGMSPADIAATID